MKKTVLTALFLVTAAFAAVAQVTIEECVSKARENYPLIKKYGLLEATTVVDLSDINKGWLPRIGVYGQLTGQNVVPSFPEALSGVLEQMGQQVNGLGKIQYKVGADISQTVWDGGASVRRREMVRTQEAVKQAALDVEMYAIKERVENLFFAILLTEEQITQSLVTHNLLTSNLEKMRVMLQNGVAMQSDVDMIEAQALTVWQGISGARSAARGYRNVLELFTGISMQDLELVRPEAAMPADQKPDRPEQRLFDSRLSLNRAAERLSEVERMPRVGFSAQAYYGYPGFDYFKSMMNRKLSLNMLAGVKVTWNIDSFYTCRNTMRRTAVENGNIEAEREVFTFNNRMQTAARREAIEGLRAVMADDERIIRLRANVRRAAESQIENGVIDATALLTKITDENLAELTARLHGIQLLQEIYKLKYILNR